MTKNSIALIGFMATGKTTLGKALSKYLGEGYKFLETDEIIIKEAKKSIPRIFEEDGEEKFREYESSTCEKVSKFNKVILSCGGGIVLNKANIDKIKQNYYIVLLRATIEEIYNRAMKDGKEARPLINKADPKKEIIEILKLRSQHYNNAAEIVINTSGKKIKDLINEIITKTLVKT